MEEVRLDQSEPFKRELRAYIEDWEKPSMKKNDKKIVLASCQNMEDSLFMILGFRRDIPLMMKKFNF